MLELFKEFDTLELAALLFFFAAWIGYDRFAHARSRTQQTLLTAVNHFRYRWMYEMLARDNRSVDAIVVGNLMRSSTFSANTTIFILAGLLGVLGHHESVSGVISAIPFARPITAIMWEFKIFLLLMIMIYAYFKYTWSLRQQNYTSIFIAAAPAHDAHAINREALAKKGAFIAGNAAEHFNYGLRAYYYALALLGWFLHPVLFMCATAFVVFVLYRREFRSQTLKNLLS